MKRYVIRDREAGNIIEQTDSIIEAVRLIKNYYKQDEKDGNYVEGFYEIYDTVKEEAVENYSTESVAIRGILGIKRIAFSRKYHIPIRTLEDWDAGINTPPDYVLELLERVATEDSKEVLKNGKYRLLKEFDNGSWIRYEAHVVDMAVVRAYYNEYNAETDELYQGEAGITIDDIINEKYTYID